MANQSVWDGRDLQTRYKGQKEANKHLHASEHGVIEDSVLGVRIGDVNLMMLQSLLDNVCPESVYHDCQFQLTIKKQRTC